MSEPSDTSAGKRVEGAPKAAWMPLPPSRRAPPRSPRGPMLLVAVAALTALVLAFLAARYQQQASGGSAPPPAKRLLTPSAVVDETAPSPGPDARSGDR